MACDGLTDELMNRQIRQTETRSERLRGIGLMLLAVLCMVGVDVTAKWLSADYALSQIVFVRGAVAIVSLLSLFSATARLSELRTQQPAVHVLRSLLSTGAIFGFFFALAHLPLAEAVTIAFAAPLLVSALSQPLLGEKVGVRRWGAVFVGFIGVLVVLRPSADLFDPAALAALGATTCYAFLVLTARIFSRTETAASLALYPFMLPTLIGGSLIAGEWRSPPALDWMPFILCGAFGALAYLAMNRALALAPPALLAPFEYVCLIGAIAAGYLVWNEVPDATTLAGAAIIVSSGLYIIHRESRRFSPAELPSTIP